MANIGTHWHCIGSRQDYQVASFTKLTTIGVSLQLICNEEPMELFFCQSSLTTLAVHVFCDGSTYTCVYNRPFHQTQLEYARHVKLLPCHVETTLQKQKSSQITPSTAPDPPPALCTSL